MKNVLIDRSSNGLTLVIILFCRKLHIMVNKFIYVDIIIKVFYQFDPKFNSGFGGSFKKLSNYKDWPLLLSFQFISFNFA